MPIVFVPRTGPPENQLCPMVLCEMCGGRIYQNRALVIACAWSRPTSIPLALYHERVLVVSNGEVVDEWAIDLRNW